MAGVGNDGEHQHGTNPVLLFVKTMAMIFVCEACVMIFLRVVPVTSHWVVVVDSLLLTAMVTPLMYWLIIKRMWNLLIGHEEAMKSLREATEAKSKFLVKARRDRKGSPI